MIFNKRLKIEITLLSTYIKRLWYNVYVIPVITEMGIIPNTEIPNITFAQYKCLSVALITNFTVKRYYWKKSQTVTNAGSIYKFD